MKEPGDSAAAVLFDRIAEAEKKNAEEMSKKAKYKIQIWFKSDRSIHKPVLYTLSAWESGKRLHGGGDEMMFLCRRHQGARKLSRFDVVASTKKDIGPLGCNKFIPGELIGPGGVVVCPHCGVRHKSDQIGDSVLYNTTVDVAARVLTDWWLRLDSNADLYAKYTPTDPRTIMMSRGYNARLAREKKGLTIYPLANIIQDTMNGSSPEARFKAFITA